MADPLVEAALARGNRVVFFDVKIGGVDVGRIKLELFASTVPRTAENFRQFCTGEHRIQQQPVGYKGARFHRVIKDFMVQGGDFLNGDGTGRMSIYGDTFEDESFDAQHDAPGLLSMANSGPDSNGCQFFITTKECHFLDNKHVVFGRCLDDASMLVVRKIENVPTSGKHSAPQLPVEIAECGEL